MHSNETIRRIKSIKKQTSFINKILSPIYTSARLGIFLFTTAFRTSLGPTQFPIQWVQGVLSPRVKRPGREADHSPPSSAEVSNEWSYTSDPSIHLHGVVLSKAQGQFCRSRVS